MKPYCSITLEDTFHDYEQCVWRRLAEDNDDDMDYMIVDCPRIQSEQMIAKTKLVKKTRIVPYFKVVSKTALENLQTKHYIKIGEECPICYEQIVHKRTAYLSNCGHAFHYKCIVDYDYHRSLSCCPKNILELQCPMCRQNMGYYPELKNKYIYGCSKLDKLEDQNNTLHFTNPKMCYVCHNVKGFNNTCDRCKLYISGKDNKYAYL